MKTYTYQYENLSSLQTFIEKNKLCDSRHILVQVYTGHRDPYDFEQLKSQLLELIPHARIFYGNEEEGVQEPARKTMLSFTTFAETSVEELTLELARLNHHLRESEQRYRSLFENNPNLIYSMDRRGIITSVNPASIKETGYLPKEIRYTPAVKFVTEEQQAAVIEHFRKTLEGEPQHFPMDLRKKDGGIQSFDITNVPIFVNENIVGVHAIAQNVTEQKKDQEKIVRLAYHDALTGLPNRLLFQQTLQSVMKRAKERQHAIAVMFIDLDRFKIINDSVGHYIGDEILKKAVANMEEAIEKDYLLSRFNGDEFMLLMPYAEGMEKVREAARALLKAFKKPIVYEGKEFFLSASIGISLYPDDAGSVEELMKNADTALNSAKQSGKGKIQFYKKAMQHDFAERFELENDLRKALDNGEFIIFYQPQVNLKTGKILGSEALIRWRHPKLGLVSPGLFISLAEETGLIHEIGRWVMRTACQQAKIWQETGHHDFSISVNVSASQFQQTGFLQDVREILVETGLPPEYLHLELTESITLHDIRHSIRHFKALKKLGVKVSIDDFGTGYSSLSYLKDFSIDILKIDRSFIRNLRDGSRDGAIIKAILTMCEGLSVTAIAEGVETREQLDLLKAYGCQCVQGFLYSQPLPVKIFSQLINVRNA
ncbi:MAG TPA: bifunctional diguanylate cyclase/phosphodiesterase [Bacillales bacterium]|nr:bifunctional diguanylate cyclase/phosphodiesterase [Bacillales bacterium]